MRSDPYTVLGVATDSGPAEWKRAYRRLAMRWHPDRNDSPEATERFKEINAAYEALLAVDPENEPKTEYSENETPAPYVDETVAKASDIRLNLEVSLEEAAAGCHKTIHYTRGSDCPTCEGSGEHGMTKTRFCDTCHGSGRVHDARRNLVRCEDCAGKGFFTERICADCGGSGRELAEVSLEIRVPPGMLQGDELRLIGQGEPGDEELEAGDLFLTLIIHTHALYELRGRDLHFQMPVSALAMMAGSEINVPSLAGVLCHTLDAGAAEKRSLRQAGKGYPGRGKKAAGDLVVKLEPVFPHKLNARQRKLLLQANTALLDDASTALPEIADWLATYGLD